MGLMFSGHPMMCLLEESSSPSCVPSPSPRDGSPQGWIWEEQVLLRRGYKEANLPGLQSQCLISNPLHVVPCAFHETPVPMGGVGSAKLPPVL